VFSGRRIPIIARVMLGILHFVQNDKLIMSKLKKVITEGLVEIVKDSAQQLAKTVSPEELLKQAAGRQTSEFTDYLKNLGSNLTPEELEKKKKELSEEEKKKMEDAKKVIQAAIPAHLRPGPKPAEPRPYEASIQEEERKKAMQVEMQKKQAQATVQAPQGKQQRGSLFARKKKTTKGFEGLVKDAKVG